MRDGRSCILLFASDEGGAGNSAFTIPEVKIIRTRKITPEIKKTNLVWRR